MGKLVTKNVTSAPRARTIEDYNEGRTKEPLYDKSSQLYPTEALPPVPIVDAAHQRLLNYNWVMAKTITLLKEDRLTVSQAGDIMFKSGVLFKLAFKKVYGKLPVLPTHDPRDANQ